MQLSRLVLAASAMALVCASGLNAAEKGRYAMTTVTNDSPYTVTYDYGWGEAGEFTVSKTLKPGQSWNHYWTYDYPGQDWSPWFYIRLEDDAVFKLRCFSVVSTNGEGKVYFIKYDAATQKFRVYAKLYKD